MQQRVIRKTQKTKKKVTDPTYFFTKSWQSLLIASSNTAWIKVKFHYVYTRETRRNLLHISFLLSLVSSAGGDFGSAQITYINSMLVNDEKKG